MIDIHLHLLPGVDDGAADLEESVAMCRLASESGCEALIATPHQMREPWFNEDPKALARTIREVQSALGPAPQLFLGAEVRVGDGLVALLGESPSSVLSLAGSRWILLEFDEEGFGPRPSEVVHELSLAGWRPIVAHPEFHFGLADNLDLMRRIVEAGARFQVTAMSLTGEFGRRARRSVTAMIDAGLVDFIASDGHGREWRPPGLRAAYEEVARRWGEPMARRLTSSNPRAILEDRPLPDRA